MILEDGSRVVGNTATTNGGGIFNLLADGTVTVQANGLVCNNTPGNGQCAGVFNGDCPNPASGICPA